MYSLYYPFKTFILSCMHDTSVYRSLYSAQHNMGNNAQHYYCNLQLLFFLLKLLQRVIDRYCAVEAHTVKVYSFIMRVAI